MLRTFRIGGIHPPENKLSAGKKITALATPKQVIIPLSQHIGAPAQAVGNMEALNVLSVGSFGSDRLETAVTRADAARMLLAAGTLLRGEKDTGLLGLLKKS